MMLYGNTVSVTYRDPGMKPDFFTGQEYFVNVSSGVFTIDLHSYGKATTIGVPLDLIASFGVASDEIEKEEK